MALCRPPSRPQLALRVQTRYRFTLTHCVSTCLFKRFTSPLRTVYKQFPLLQTFSPFRPKRGAYKRATVYKRGGGGWRRGSDIVVSFKTKVECAGNTEFRKYLSGTSWDPSRLTDLNTAARQTDRRTLTPPHTIYVHAKVFNKMAAHNTEERSNSELQKTVGKSA